MSEVEEKGTMIPSILSLMIHKGGGHGVLGGFPYYFIL